MSLYLMRHAQSVGNVTHRVQGQLVAPPLTRDGVREALWQAEALASHVRSRGHIAVRIVSSDQRRAAQTAFAVRWATGSEQINWEPRLREQHLGSMEGKMPAELRAEPVPDGEHISEVRWAGGESLADVARRVRSWLEDIGDCAQDPSSAVIAVSHGTTLAVIDSLLTGGTHRDVDFDEPWGNAAWRRMPVPSVCR